MKHSIPLLAAVLALACGPVLAQDEGKTEEAAKAEQEAAQSEQIVKQEAGQVVEETRIDGRLQGVKVKPRRGPEYFFDDRAGDGTLTMPDGGELDSESNIRTWKLGEW